MIGSGQASWRVLVAGAELPLEIDKYLASFSAKVSRHTTKTNYSPLHRWIHAYRTGKLEITKRRNHGYDVIDMLTLFRLCSSSTSCTTKIQAIQWNVQGCRSAPGGSVPSHAGHRGVDPWCGRYHSRRQRRDCHELVDRPRIALMRLAICAPVSFPLGMTCSQDGAVQACHQCSSRLART